MRRQSGDDYPRRSTRRLIAIATRSTRNLLGRVGRQIEHQRGLCNRNNRRTAAADLAGGGPQSGQRQGYGTFGLLPTLRLFVASRSRQASTVTAAGLTVGTQTVSDSLASGAAISPKSQAGTNRAPESVFTLTASTAKGAGSFEEPTPGAPGTDPVPQLERVRTPAAMGDLSLDEERAMRAAATTPLCRARFRPRGRQSSCCGRHQ